MGTSTSINRPIIYKEHSLERHELITGYILAFLHLPQGKWDAGYGRAYIDHLLNDETVLDLAKNEITRSIVPRVANFYRAFVSRLASRID